MAWRNLWRNRKRTFITIAAILCAIVFANLMDAWYKGVNKQMLDSMVGVYSGHGQIQMPEFWEDKSLHYTFIPEKNLYDFLNNMKSIQGYTPRLESYALASLDNLTKGVLVVGIDTEKEKYVTNLPRKVIAGAYFGAATGEALVGEGLSQYLDIQHGDTLVMVGEGYHGALAAGKYLVRGIIRLGHPDLDNNIVYLSLGDAQYFYGAESRITSVVLFLQSKDPLNLMVAEVQNHLQKPLTVLRWEEMMPMINQSLGLIDGMGVITLLLVYVLISFTILGTIVMMTSERIGEFKILLAVGMRKKLMGFMILLEMATLALLGAILGFTASYPVVKYFNLNPIELKGKGAEGFRHYGLDPVLPTLIDFTLFAKHTLIILLVSVLLSFYAINIIRKLKVV